MSIYNSLPVTLTIILIDPFRLHSSMRVQSERNAQVSENLLISFFFFSLQRFQEIVPFRKDKKNVIVSFKNVKLKMFSIFFFVFKWKCIAG